MQTKILYEDDVMLVIHKPAGLAVQSARIGQMDVESELRNYIAAQARKTNSKVAPYVGLVHRLDQPVEGLLVVAKTKEAAAALTKQLTNGSLNKKYMAVVQTSHTSEEGTFCDFMIKEGQVAKIVSSNEKQAKEARLQYRIVKTADILEKVQLALVDIEIETGRFHQIRCQMASHNMPLLGDSKYGSEQTKELSRQLGIRNVALCANRITCIHPKTKKCLNFEVQPQNVAFSKFE